MLGSDLIPPHPARSSEEIAEIYRPFIITRIEALGANRCRFESNFPVDRSASSYSTLRNAFKRIAAPASPGEETDLFVGTAQRVYRLGETKSVRAARYTTTRNTFPRSGADCCDESSRNTPGLQ
jgi:hypothetical protein